MDGHAIAATVKELMMAIKREPCDVWFSKAVRLRDGRCMSCGYTERLEAAHIYGRRNKRLRWAMWNCCALCHGCHRHYTESPVQFFDWLRETYGEERLDWLRKANNEIYKTTKELRKEIAAHYRDEVRRKEADPCYVIQSWN